MSRCLAILAVCVTASMATADPPASDAQARATALFERGGKAFRDKQFDAAAALFKEAYDASPDPAFLYNIGLCYERRGRWRLAVDYYERFLAEAPDAPAVPDVRRRRDQAIKMREAEMAVVTLTGAPPGAQVEVEALGKPVRCVTPCTLRVDPGPVALKAMLGPEVATATRTLEPSETWAPELTFGKSVALGTVLVRVDVTGATITVGGKEIAAGFAVAWPAGTWRVVVSHPRYPSFEADVSVEPDRTRIVDAQLRPLASARGQRLAGWIALGAGSAVLVNGVIFGSLALIDFNDAQAQADRGIEPGDDARRAIETKSLVADISFGVALAGVVTGIVLVWTAEDSDAAEGAPAAAPALVRF